MSNVFAITTLNYLANEEIDAVYGQFMQQVAQIWHVRNSGEKSCPDNILIY